MVHWVVPRVTDMSFLIGQEENNIQQNYQPCDCYWLKSRSSSLYTSKHASEYVRVTFSSFAAVKGGREPSLHRSEIGRPCLVQVHSSEFCSVIRNHKMEIAKIKSNWQQRCQGAVSEPSPPYLSTTVEKVDDVVLQQNELHFSLQVKNMHLMALQPPHNTKLQWKSIETKIQSTGSKGNWPLFRLGATM